MANPSTEDPRLTRLSQLALALALPEATRLIAGTHAQFLVRKKTFAYFLDNHHGDGIVAVTCKVLPADNRRWSRLNRGGFIFLLILHRGAGCVSPGYREGKGPVVGKLGAGRTQAVS